MPSEPNEQDVLSRVLKETAEQAAFLFLEEGTPAANGDVETLHAVIALSRAEGVEKLVLRMPKTTALEVAANMLGSDADDPEVVSSCQSAVGELLNIIAGVFIVARFGKGAHCDIGIPAIGPGRGPEGSGVTLYADGAPVELSRAS